MLTLVRSLAEKPLPTILLLCQLLQSGAALWVVNDYESPNAATRTALTLVATGEYAVREIDWRQPEVVPAADHAPARMLHLPGEVLYQAAGFRLLPSSWWPLLHLPVMLLLTGAVVYCATLLLGPRGGWVAGLLACLHPFLLLHGPVWDDTFTAAALEWLALALLLSCISARDVRTNGWWWYALLFIAAGLAAVMRLQSLLTLAAFATLCILLPSLKPLRIAMCVMLLGMATATAGWTLRNHAVSGHWLAGTTHDGVTLWEANSPQAWRALRETGQAQESYGAYETEKLAVLQNMGEWEADRYFTQRALDHVGSHPWQALGLSLTKVGLTLSGIDPQLPLASLRNIVALLFNALALLVCAQAARSADMKGWSPATQCFAVFVLAAAGSAVLMAMIGPIGWRYRIDLEGVLAILAALVLMKRLTSPAGNAEGRT